MATTKDFDGMELQDAISETFKYRKTSLDEIVAFERGFADDSLRQSRWNAFIKKKKALISVTLEETIHTMEAFLEPVAEAIKSNLQFTGKWDHEEGKWELR